MESELAVVDTEEQSIQRIEQILLGLYDVSGVATRIAHLLDLRRVSPWTFFEEYKVTTLLEEEDALLREYEELRRKLGLTGPSPLTSSRRWL